MVSENEQAKKVARVVKAAKRFVFYQTRYPRSLSAEAASRELILVTRQLTAKPGGVPLNSSGKLVETVPNRTK